MKSNTSVKEFSSSLNTGIPTFPPASVVDNEYDVIQEESNGKNLPLGGVNLFQLPLETTKASVVKKAKSQNDWAEIYFNTVLFPVSFEKGCKSYYLRTGDPKVARRLRRKAGYRERSTRQLWGPCPKWYLETGYSSQANAVRSLSRILRQDCYWDETRCEIKVRPQPQEKGIALWI